MLDAPAPTARDPFKCPECGFMGASLKGLTAHRYYHTVTPAVCPDCGRVFRNVAKHRYHKHRSASKTEVMIASRGPVVRASRRTPAAASVSDQVEPIRALAAAVDAIRGYCTKLEEENKLLRREAEKAQLAMDRVKNFLASK
jgi:predicted RNA-binding Zn-ribbon protein involved in translation (DUF1610 family)